MKNALSTILVLVLLVGCVQEEDSAQQLQKYRHYRVATPSDITPPRPNAIYTNRGYFMLPGSQNDEGCTYYTLHRKAGTVNTMPIYFLHESGGFSRSSEGCI